MEFEEWSNKQKEQRGFENWSNRQKEQQDFEKWGASRPPSATDEGRRASSSDLKFWTERSEGTKFLSRNRENERKRSTAESVKTGYSPPYIGAGDAARLGVEPTQPAQSTPMQPEIKIAPASRRGGVTLPNVEEINAKAKITQSQAVASTKKPDTQTQTNTFTTKGQSERWGTEATSPKTFTFSQSPKAEIPANRFSGEGNALPGFEARTGMSAYDLAQKPLAATSSGEYTNNWNNKEPKSRGADYLDRSVNQLALGNYSDDATLLGTAVQVGLGITGLDLPMDIRDLTYDLTNWEWTPEHIARRCSTPWGLFRS